jgi:hypothetical protein
MTVDSVSFIAELSTDADMGCRGAQPLYAIKPKCQGQGRKILFANYTYFVHTFFSVLNWFCREKETILPWFSIIIVPIIFTLIQVMFPIVT